MLDMYIEDYIEVLLIIANAVTHKVESATWLKPIDTHRFLLAEIYLYVFDSNYNQENQRRSSGEFEIRFIKLECMFSFPVLFWNLLYRYTFLYIIRTSTLHKHYSLLYLYLGCEYRTQALLI